MRFELRSIRKRAPKQCPRCLERRVERKMDGQVRECIQYYHRIVAVVVVSGQLDLWHLPEIYWPVADRSVRVLKTVRRRRRSRIVAQDKSVPARQQTQSSEDIATNFYASNLELGSIPPLFLHLLGRSRWRIDAQVFQTITTDSHLKKPSAHQSQALVVLTMIRLLAYTLSLLFYHRQVLSHAAATAPAMFRELSASFRRLFHRIHSG